MTRVRPSFWLARRAVVVLVDVLRREQLQEGAVARQKGELVAGSRRRADVFHVQDEMVAGGAQDLRSRIKRTEQLRHHVLTAEGEDRAASRAAILDLWRHVAHHVLGADPNRPGRLVQALDDRRRDQEGVQMELRQKRFAGQRVAPQQDRLPNTQRGDAGRQLASQGQRQTA